MRHFRWIDWDNRYRLAIQYRPRGGEWLKVDLLGLTARGVDVLVSMQPEADAMLMGLGEEPQVAAEVGLEFRRFSVPDHQVPSDPAAALAFAQGLAEAVSEGRGVLLHCYAGIGRSGTMGDDGRHHGRWIVPMEVIAGGRRAQSSARCERLVRIISARISQPSCLDLGQYWSLR